MEIWKSIKGYEGFYEVSNLGNVKSIQRNIILKSRTDKNGYKACTLCDSKHKHKSMKVHRLVYEAFNGDLDLSLVIDHRDTIKANNEATNLRQITSRENTTISKTRVSNYRGVRLFKPNQKWGSEIQINGHRYFLGLHDTAELASLIYETTLNKWLNDKIKPVTIREGFKLCKVCGKELEVSEFHTTKTLKGTASLMYQCKECESKAKKIRYNNSKIR